jgi:hypothetical protein
MKTPINIAGKNYTVSANLAEEGTTFPGSDDNVLHNEFRVVIAGNGAKASFSFFGSHFDYQKGVKSLNAIALMDAVSCFISDAVCGSQSFEDFCSDLGYDQDSRKAKRTHKACIKQYEKASKLFESIEDAYNEIQELTNA